MIKSFLLTKTPTCNAIAMAIIFASSFFEKYGKGILLVKLRDWEMPRVIGVKFSNNKMSSLLFADDFVGIAETGSALQGLIDILHNYNKHWWSETNLKKCAIIIFQKQEKGPGKWAWGKESFPF